MQIFLTLFGLLVQLVEEIRSGAMAGAIVSTAITDILGVLTPAQLSAAEQLVLTTGEEGLKAAWNWLISTGPAYHGPTDTDEARDLEGVVLAALGEAGPELT